SELKLPHGERAGFGSRHSDGRQTLMPSARPMRGPPPNKQALPTGQSASAVQPGSRSAQNSRQRPPQPLDGSPPHTTLLHEGVHGHSPHNDATVPQPPETGLVTQMDGTQTFGKGRS